MRLVSAARGAQGLAGAAGGAVKRCRGCAEPGMARSRRLDGSTAASSATGHPAAANSAHCRDPPQR